jgi:hypothetical protein
MLGGDCVEKFSFWSTNIFLRMGGIKIRLVQLIAKFKNLVLNFFKKLFFLN